MNEIRWMRAPQLAKYLNVGLSTIWAMVKNGKIQSKKISPRITVFDKIEIDKMMANVDS
ncbi:MAG: helix-turn-helix domain-containing protein [Sulfurimonas sp.]|nr:helix-turn-helix domain-containing protein [Sulfurimonas sp.]MDD3835481.1 helix-turn-helix domain-containing protein [Sulfurimonas sp.]